jgi:hypothetical protein
VRYLTFGSANLRPPVAAATGGGEDHGRFEPREPAAAPGGSDSAAFRIVPDVVRVTTWTLRAPTLETADRAARSSPTCECRQRTMPCVPSNRVSRAHDGKADAKAGRDKGPPSMRNATYRVRPTSSRTVIGRADGAPGQRPVAPGPGAPTAAA